MPNDSSLTPRPMSLPLLRPSSPLILSSESPSEVITRWTVESDYSPISTPTLSSLDHTTPHVYTAHIAARATADLVRILDLSFPADTSTEMERNTKVIGKPQEEISLLRIEGHGRQGEAGERGGGVILPFENPRTPPAPPKIPLPHSPTSPLTRENMARLKHANKTSPDPPTYGQSSLSQPSSPVEQRRNHLDNSKQPLGSPVKLARAAATPADTASKDVKGVPNTSRWTMTTESSIFSINTDDFIMPQGNGPARSDTYQWPLHGPRSRAAMESDTASISRFVFPSPRRQSPESRDDRRAVQNSFMSLNGDGTTSTTYNFPPSAPPTISRLSIATDASSAYAPSIAAPSSIARRTAAWTRKGTRTETVPEEDETESLADFRPQPVAKSQTQSPPPPPKHSRVKNLAANKNNGTTLLPHDVDSPTTTNSSGDHASQISGDTFGARRRRWSISAPIKESSDGGAEDDDHSAYLSDGESVQYRRRAPAHLANRSSIASLGQSGVIDIEVHQKHHQAGVFPSPTIRRHAHRKPETDDEITTYLLKAASKSDRRIVPTNRDKSIAPSGTPFPPSSGTRLKGLTEEDSSVDESDREYGVEMPPQTPQSKRMMSKVDQILGQGAYEAGLALNNERKILKEALDRSIISRQSTPGTPRGSQTLLRPLHHASASLPVYLTPTPKGQNSNMDSPYTNMRIRNGSIDSNFSHNPSIADSITKLIPTYAQNEDKYNAKPLPLVPAQILGANHIDMAMRDDLTPEQRFLLRRRAKVLEKRLGETLREDATGQWIIEPSGGESGVHQRASPGSSFANKAKNAFGKDKKEYEKPYNVEHQMRVSDQEVPELEPYVDPAAPAILSESVSSQPTSPSRPNTAADEDQQARTHRIRQLAKLNKMLGTLVTPDQLAAHSSSPDSFSLHSSGPHMSSDQISFISFEDDSPPRRGIDTPKDPNSASKWTDKIRQTMGRRSNSNNSVHKLAEDQSFFDFRKDTGWRTHKTSASSPAQQSQSERIDDSSSQPRKMSAEDGIFGNHSKSWGKKKSSPYAEIIDHSDDYTLASPPKPTLPPFHFEAQQRPRSPTSPGTPASATPATPHAIDHTIFPRSVDNTSPSPSHLYFDSNSGSARVKRTEKLSQFFGEPIDLTHPPRPPTPVKSRKESMDDSIGELWRALQVEGKKGKFRGW